MQRENNRHIRQRTITEIVTFIQNNRKFYTISQLCSASKFPRSTYYKALVCVPSNRQKEYEAFSGKVKQAFDESKQRYGAVKIYHSLNDNGMVPGNKENILDRNFEAESIHFLVR